MNNYDKYKSTGHHWIGDIPSCWGCNRVGRTTYVKGRIGWKNLRAEDFTDKGPYLVTGTDFDSGKINWSKSHHVDDERYDEDPFIQLEKQDVLITKDGTIGKIAYLDDIPDRATLNSGIFVTRPLSNDLYIQRYFFWIVSSPLFDEFVRYNSSGSTILHLYQNVFERFYFPIPSIEEQHLISHYLDKKTSQIDSLVEKIQKKIDLLKEQRTSLINHYVTKGLDPIVEMKDSGVEWIGEIPRHWRISKLKYLISILGGGTPNTDTKEYWGGNIPWVSPKDMKTHLINSSEDYITELGLKESTTNLIEPMSLLIVFRSGILQRTIPVGRNMVPVAINQDLKAITSKDSGFLLDFLFLWIKGNEQNLLKQWSKKGVTVESLESDYLLNSIVPIPPLEEQKSIKGKLLFFDKNHFRLVELLENKIQKLMEYRQSLISSVVTGKVRVTEGMI